MTNPELRAARQALGLQIQYCADSIGRCSERTWRYWENGRDDKSVPVPADVAERMEKLAAAHLEALA